jgi:putative membrane protein insertion efficiency factor
MLSEITKKTTLFFIDAYRHALSPFLPPSCRFTPTCSQYSRDAIEKYGAARGSLLALKRLMKCHPLHPGGYDPVK